MEVKRVEPVFDKNEWLLFNKNYQKELRHVFRGANDHLKKLFYENDETSWKIAKKQFRYFKNKIDERSSDNWVFSCIKYLKKYLHLENENYACLKTVTEPGLGRAKNPSAHENYFFLANAELGIFINYLKDTFGTQSGKNGETRNIEIFDTLLTRMIKQRSFIFYQIRNEYFGEDNEAVFVNSIQNIEPFRMNPVLLRPDGAENPLENREKFNQFREKAVENSKCCIKTGKMTMGEIGTVELRKVVKFETITSEDLNYPGTMVLHIFEDIHDIYRSSHGRPLTNSSNNRENSIVNIHARCEISNQACIIPVWKNLLTTNLAYFKILFSNKWVDSDIQNITSLKLISSAQTIQLYLESLISGNISIQSETSVLKVFKLAEFLSDFETCSKLKPFILTRLPVFQYVRYPLLKYMTEIQDAEVSEYADEIFQEFLSLIKRVNGTGNIAIEKLKCFQVQRFSSKTVTSLTVSEFRSMFNSKKEFFGMYKLMFRLKRKIDFCSNHDFKRRKLN